MNRNIYDNNFWYVVNEACRHIVYRNRDKAKADAYANRKNTLMLDNNIADMSYSVMSGAEIKNEHITSIGRLSAAS